MIKRRREIWIDNVKVIACILVALGYFFQSMVKSGILSDCDLYRWFDTTVHYFPIPLFFICSGYLYQKYSCVNSIKSWRQNITKRALALMVPYFTFSTATWLLERALSSPVSGEANLSWAEAMFISPLSPYWFLFTLFFIFLITPTFPQQKNAAVGLTVAVLLKSVTFFERTCSITLIQYVISNEIWFVLGMCLCTAKFTAVIHKKKHTWMQTGLVGFTVFIILSVWIYYKVQPTHSLIAFFLGLLACLSIILMVSGAFNERYQTKGWRFFVKYTMPIFLMHTLFPAPVRVLLLKYGIVNPYSHLVCGLAVTIACPIAAGWIMQKLKWPEFFLYPGKFIVKFIKLTKKRDKKNKKIKNKK